MVKQLKQINSIQSEGDSLQYSQINMERSDYRSTLEVYMLRM